VFFAVETRGRSIEAIDDDMVARPAAAGEARLTSAGRGD
jgi:hypothetical protein